MLTRGSKPVLRKSSQSKVLLYDHDVAESDHNMEDNHVKCAKIQADTFTGYNVFFFLKNWISLIVEKNAFHQRGEKTK